MLPFNYMYTVLFLVCVLANMSFAVTTTPIPLPANVQIIEGNSSIVCARKSLQSGLDLGRVFWCPQLNACGTYTGEDVPAMFLPGNGCWCYQLQCSDKGSEANTPSTVRLVGGADPRVGRVEIYHNGRWGTICDDGFSPDSAVVICRMLGYEVPLPTIWGDAQFGPGLGDIWMDDVVCNGTEATIEDCSHNGFGVHNCDHSEDVSVRCIVDT